MCRIVGQALTDSPSSLQRGVRRRCVFPIRSISFRFVCDLFQSHSDAARSCRARLSSKRSSSSLSGRPPISASVCPGRDEPRLHSPFSVSFTAESRSLRGSGPDGLSFLPSWSARSWSKIAVPCVVLTVSFIEFRLEQ